MIRSCRAIIGVILCLVSAAAYSQCPSTGAACTVTISPGNGLQAAIEARSPGQTVCLNPGIYTPANTGLWVDVNAFGLGKSGVTVCGLGATPASVELRGAASTASDYAVKFWTYAAGNPTNMTLANVTVTGAGGVMVWDAPGGGRISGVTLKDIVVNTALVPSSSVHSAGVLLQKADNIVMDNVTVSSQSNGFFMIDATGSVMMNSKVNNTIDDFTSGIAVFGGSGNVFVNNTIGTTPGAPSTYTIKGDAVNFYNTIGNRFENNTVQGFRDNGIDIHAADLTGYVPKQNSLDNYIGKNTVIGRGLADGRVAGAAIWSNCASNRTWIFGNDSQGVPECGTCIYTSQNNMVLGNTLHNNGGTGVLVSGGQETLPFCPFPDYQVKPVSTFVQSNATYYNKLADTYFRSADTTTITRNYFSPHNGFAGAQWPCTMPACENAVVLDAATGNTTGNTVPYAKSTNGVRILANTNHDNQLGIAVDNNFTTGVEFAYNRWIQPNNGLSYNRMYTSSALNWDGGSVLTGGNFWSLFAGANGNPGTAPYSGIYTSPVNATGLIVDRFPYKNEDFGKGSTVTVFEPLSPGGGATLAQGTKRVVRWYAPGCVYNDISLVGATTTALLTNIPNTGYAVVTLPTVTVGTYQIVVSCKNSAGTVSTTGNTANFSAGDNRLQLLAPGRDDMFDAGSTINVAVKKNGIGVGTVTVQLSTDGGVTFPTTLGSFAGTTGRVTLPAGAAVSRAVIRVNGGFFEDRMDGTFGIRGTGAGFSNVGSGRAFKQGEMERLEWSSPVGSRLVTINATVGSVTKNVATDLPDRGSFDWIVPEFGSGGVLTLTTTYKNAAGTQIGSAVTNTSGSVVGPTTITFTGVPSLLQPGSSTTITATASSGATVTLTSATTSICTISGGTVTGVANGTCTINANAPATGSFAAATSSTSFLVSSDPPRLGNISTRMRVLTGNNVMIAGFVIGGTTPKTVAIQAIGPALAGAGIPNYLPNPTLQLVRSSDGATIATNDDWGTAPNKPAIQTAGFAPSNALESAIMMTLDPGAYTAIVSGVGGSTGVGLVGVYEVDHPDVPLVNISTRGLVLTGNDVMIAGFVVNGSGSQNVVIQGIGPSLAAAGIPNYLPNPTLQLVRASDGATIATNDDWGTAPNKSAIQSAGFAPGNAVESAIMMSLPPGAYTAILSGAGGTTGVGIIGVYTTP